MLSYSLTEFVPGASFPLGPFRVTTRPLPHFVPNAGIRLSAGGFDLAYTGDSGPSPEVVALAREADVLIAGSSYLDDVPDDLSTGLSSATIAARQAREAGVGRLMLTHLMPGVSADAARDAAASYFTGEIDVA